MLKIKKLLLILFYLEVKYIIVDYLNDTSQTIYNKINQLNITNIVNVGLFQENFNIPTYQFVRSFQRSVLDNVQKQDPSLNTWVNLLIY